MVEFKTDEQGNIILKPLTGWELRHVSGMLVILGVEYADSQDELERGLSRTLPLVLKPEQALEFAEALKKAASGMLASIPSGTPVQ